MSKHTHDKNSHFIPSPFGVVTSYENAFIEAFNKNLSGAVAEVLKYIASATASAIKNGIELEKSETDELEKAHSVGDIHPSHSDWVWTEYAPGKFDWRSNKTKGGSKALKPYEVLPEVKKMKTSGEVVKWAIGKGVILSTGNTKLDKIDLESSKQIFSALYNIQQQFHFQPVNIHFKKLKGATMSANGGEININSDYFTNFNAHRYWINTNTDYIKKYDENIKVFQDKIKKREAQIKSKTATPQLIKYWKDKIDGYKKAIKKYEDEKKRFPRWTMGDEKTLAADIVIHELGHVLNAQCTGGCGWYRVNGVKRNQEYTKLAMALNDERNAIYKRYLKEPEVLSEYSTTKPAEFFAESFVAYVHKDKKLPKYVSDFFDKYFKSTIPLR